MSRYKQLMRLTLAVLCVAAAALATASPSNKWRLQVSGNAESDGVISVWVAPVDSAPLQVDINISKGNGENHVAKRITRGLRLALPSGQYHVERDDGEDVLIKKRLGAPRFEVHVHANTVKGVRVNRDRE